MYKIPPPFVLWPSMSLPAPCPANSLQHTHSGYTPHLLGALGSWSFRSQPCSDEKQHQEHREGDSFSPLAQTEKHRRKKPLLLKILFLFPSYSYCLSSFSLSLLFLKEAQTYSAIIWTPSPSKFTPGFTYDIHISPWRRLGSIPVFYQLWFRLPAKASRACWETELGPFTGEDKQVISAPVLNDLTI